jgi:hypothetical protein
VFKVTEKLTRENKEKKSTIIRMVPDNLAHKKSPVANHEADYIKKQLKPAGKYLTITATYK